MVEFTSDEKISNYSRTRRHGPKKNIKSTFEYRHITENHTEQTKDASNEKTLTKHLTNPSKQIDYAVNSSKQRPITVVTRSSQNRIQMKRNTHTYWKRFRGHPIIGFVNEPCPTTLGKPRGWKTHPFRC